MCGIWALLSKTPITRFGPLYDSFMQIKKRGPEYSSFDLVTSNALLGFHRLAIMDVTADGNQPFKMVRPNGSCIYCICNGEIYDHEKLKNVYKIQTKSHSDCEVIIPLYEQIGFKETVKLLGSEFACVILDVSADGKKATMYVARDPMGVRPLFYAQNNSQFCVSSEMKGLCDEFETVKVFPPGHYAEIDFSTSINGILDGTVSMSHGDYSTVHFVEYYSYNFPLVPVTNMSNVYHNIRTLFTSAVSKRLMTERPFGCLLSGSLDSSLACAVAKSLMPKGTNFPAFTIALNTGSTDLPYAQSVASFLGVEHHIVEITIEEALEALALSVYVTESWDITTNRANVMQMLIAKYISTSTNIRVLLVGEYSDEVFLGYLYEHNAPSVQAAHEDSVRLTKDAHMFDGVRADRSMAYYGLEARMPFGDRDLVSYVQGLDPALVVPQNGLEKALLRKAFEDTGLLPNEVLFRRKEAFSDAVSTQTKSWYQSIQEHIETIVTDTEFNTEAPKFKWCTPYTKESYYYRKLFTKYFGEGEGKSKVIPYYWLPRWTSETTDPSARTLKLYNDGK